ncbi:MAG: hypothetical protein KAG97_11405, partial [Victivallales bacterium]|nr:hypothetical protein [Victivallales bacterium]
AKRRPGIQARPKLMASMKLAASLDNGDWKTADDILSSKKAMTSSDLANIRRLRSWTASLVFAKGLVALQFGDSNAVDDANAALIQSIGASMRKKNLLPLAASLAMEFAVLRRNNPTAIKIANTYTFNEKNMWWWKIEGRLPLLEILARCSANRNPKKAISSFSKRYAEVPALKGDRLWLDSAAKLLSGQPLNPRQIQMMASQRCHFRDTTARVVSAALAQYYVETKKGFPKEWRLLSLIEAQITPAVVSGDLWRRTILLRLARGKTPQWFERQANKRLNTDFRISASKAYPLLLELKIGAQVATGKLSPVAAKKILADFLKASTVAGKDEIDNLDVMTSPEPAAIVKRLFAERRPSAAVRAALLALATQKKAEIKTAVSSVLKENASVLQWEELYILQIMERWRR